VRKHRELGCGARGVSSKSSNFNEKRCIFYCKGEVLQYLCKKCIGVRQ